MFSLEQAMAEWQRQMRAAGIKSAEALAELESHLREEVERQIKSGSSAQTAFQIAVERIGRGNLLQTEFRKVGGMGKTQLRKASGYFYTAILGLYTLATTYAMFKYNLSANEWLLGLAAQATLLVCSGFVWRIALRFFPVIASRRTQSTAGLIGGVSGAVWFIIFAHFILPRFNFTPGQLMVAVLWAMVPTLVLPTTAFLVLDKSENALSRATDL